MSDVVQTGSVDTAWCLIYSLLKRAGVTVIQINKKNRKYMLEHECHIRIKNALWLTSYKRLFAGIQLWLKWKNQDELDVDNTQNPLDKSKKSTDLSLATNKTIAEDSPLASNNNVIDLSLDDEVNEENESVETESYDCVKLLLEIFMLMHGREICLREPWSFQDNTCNSSSTTEKTPRLEVQNLKYLEKKWALDDEDDLDAELTNIIESCSKTNIGPPLSTESEKMPLNIEEDFDAEVERLVKKYTLIANIDQVLNREPPRPADVLASLSRDTQSPNKKANASAEHTAEETTTSGNNVIVISEMNSTKSNNNRNLRDENANVTVDKKCIMSKSNKSLKTTDVSTQSTKKKRKKTCSEVDKVSLGEATDKALNIDNNEHEKEIQTNASQVLQTKPATIVCTNVSSNSNNTSSVKLQADPEKATRSKKRKLDKICKIKSIMCKRRATISFEPSSKKNLEDSKRDSTSMETEADPEKASATEKDLSSLGETRQLEVLALRSKTIAISLDHTPTIKKCKIKLAKQISKRDSAPAVPSKTPKPKKPVSESAAVTQENPSPMIDPHIHLLRNSAYKPRTLAFPTYQTRARTVSKANGSVNSCEVTNTKSVEFKLNTNKPIVTYAKDNKMVQTCEKKVQKNYSPSMLSKIEAIQRNRSLNVVDTNSKVVSTTSEDRKPAQHLERRKLDRNGSSDDASSAESDGVQAVQKVCVSQSTAGASAQLNKAEVSEIENSDVEIDDIDNEIDKLFPDNLDDNKIKNNKKENQKTKGRASILAELISPGQRKQFPSLLPISKAQTLSVCTNFSNDSNSIATKPPPMPTHNNSPEKSLHNSKKLNQKDVPENKVQQKAEGVAHSASADFNNRDASMKASTPMLDLSHVMGLLSCVECYAKYHSNNKACTLIDQLRMSLSNPGEDN